MFTDSSTFELVQGMDDRLLDVFEVTENVISAARHLQPRWSTGPDGIPPVILKGCIIFLALVLTYIFNLPLSTGKFPNPCKVAAVSPIFKSGSRLQLGNYRPISNLCSAAKLFEYVVSCLSSRLETF